MNTIDTGFTVDYYTKYDRDRTDMCKKIVINKELDRVDRSEIDKLNQRYRLFEPNTAASYHLIQVIDSDGIFLDICGIVTIGWTPEIYILPAYKKIINCRTIRSIYINSGQFPWLNETSDTECKKPLEPVMDSQSGSSMASSFSSLGGQ